MTAKIGSTWAEMSDAAKGLAIIIALSTSVSGLTFRFLDYRGLPADVARISEELEVRRANVPERLTEVEIRAEANALRILEIERMGLARDAAIDDIREGQDRIICYLRSYAQGADPLNCAD